MTPHELAVAYLYDAWNRTEQANRLVEGARAQVGRRDYDDALADLKIALDSAERAPARLRDAIRMIQEAAEAAR